MVHLHAGIGAICEAQTPLYPGFRVGAVPAPPGRSAVEPLQARPRNLRMSEILW